MKLFPAAKKDDW